MKASRVLFSLALCSLLVAAFAAAGRAAAQDDIELQPGDDKLPSELIIEPIGVRPVGEPITIKVQLLGQEGRVQPNKVLVFYLNGERLRRSRTADDGTTAIRLSDLRPDDYTLVVEYEGTQAYAPATAEATFTVRPALVTIQTVPPLPGIPFELDGREFVSGEDGKAEIEISELGVFPLVATLPDNTEVVPGIKATFDRWSEEFQPERVVEVRGDIFLEAGFSVSHPLGFTFKDLDENPVSIDRIETITIKGSDASRFTYEDDDAGWLRSRRIVRRRAGLEAALIQYSVESVMIDGANVVNQYQQRFFVDPEVPTLEIQLLLYHARFRAVDAVFGFPIGTGVSVEYPNGRIEEIPFDDANEVRIGPVARGVYRVQVQGVAGMVPVTPVALSRDQDVVLKVVSILDIGLAVSGGIIFAFGLLLYGRPHLPRLILHKAASILQFLMSRIRGRNAAHARSSLADVEQQPH